MPNIKKKRKNTSTYVLRKVKVMILQNTQGVQFQRQVKLFHPII